MKTIEVDNVWPRHVIEFGDGLGRVLHVTQASENKNIAVIEYSWHQDGRALSYCQWNDRVSLVSEEELSNLMK